MATKRIESASDAEYVDVESDDRTEFARDERSVDEEIQQEFDSDPDTTTWRIKISKINERTKHWTDCFYCTPEDFPLLDRLRDEWGGGTFRALVYKSGKLHRNIAYRVATPLAPRADSSPPSQISELGQLLQRQTDQIANLLQGRGSVDPMSQMRGMLEMFVLMREAFPAEKKGGDLEMFLKALEVAKEMTGESTGKTVMDVVAELVRSPMAERLVSAFPAQGALAAPVSPGQLPRQAVAPVRQPVTIGLGAAGEFRREPASASIPLHPMIAQMDEQSQIQLKSQLHEWRMLALRGADPLTYAEVALDKYGDEFMIYLSSLPNLREIVSTLDPEVNECWPWIEQLRAGIFELTGPDQSEDNGEDFGGMFEGEGDGAGDESPENSAGSNVPSSSPPSTEHPSANLDADSGRSGRGGRDSRSNGETGERRAKKSARSSTRAGTDKVA